MADKKDEQITPTAEPVKTDEPKPILGKFTSVEELEKSYVELEKKRRGDDERFADLEKKYDELVTYQEPETPIVPETTPPAKTTNTEFLAGFYADPERVLRERDAATEKRVIDAMNNRMGAQRMMDGYYRDNPDLQRYEDLLEFQFGRQPEKLPPSERLDRAGKRVREMLVAAKGIKEPGSDQLNADNYVEGPTGRENAPPVVVEKPISADEELKAYVKERHAEQARGLVPPDLSRRK